MLSRLKWLTFLSLDAPLVAIAWQALFAHEHSIDLAWHHALIVFMGVWLGYAADRWFDNLKTQRPSSRKHQFYAQHKGSILVVWIIVLVASTSLSFARLTNQELGRGFTLLAVSLAYTVFAQRARSFAGYPFLKSLFTAFLILASALLFMPLGSVPILACLATWMLFVSNCLFIRSWTHSGEPKAAQLAAFFALGSVSLSVFALWTQDPTTAGTCLIAQIGIVLLHLFRHRIDTSVARTAADLCLLSPFLFLFV